MRLLLAAWAGVLSSAWALEVRQVLVPERSHPALGAAARLLTRDFSLTEAAIISVPPGAQPKPGQLLLTTNSPSAAQAGFLGLGSGGALPADGYGIVFTNGATWLYGQRPRALLFAAGDLNHWKLQPSGTFRRQPAFAFRSASLHGRLPLPEYVARIGVNAVIGRGESPVSFRETFSAVYEKLEPSTRQQVERRAERAAAAHRRLAEECQIGRAHV